MAIEESTSIIADLINEFCWRVDNGRGDEVAALFTKDGTVDTPHFNLAGLDEIHSWFSARATGATRISRHFVTNLRIRKEEDESYVAEAYSMTLVGVPPVPCQGSRLAAGTSTDRIVIEGGKALFASRRLDLAFEGQVGELELHP